MIMKAVIIVLLVLGGIVFVSKKLGLNETEIKENVPIDDTSQVDLLYKVDDSTFPEHWVNSEIDAHVEEIDSAEFAKNKIILEQALSKYPLSVLQKHLNRIYIFENMTFYGLGYGGTYYENTVYVVLSEYDDYFIEESFHHEFSSVLLESNPSFLNKKAWKACNELDYWDESGGVNALNGRSSEEFDASLHEKGFLHEYATTDMENDLNSFAEHMFSGTKEFYAVCENYPKLKKKFKLAVEFYSKLDPAMNEEFFLRFRK
jgi:hypothetical protein